MEPSSDRYLGLPIFRGEPRPNCSGPPCDLGYKIQVSCKVCLRKGYPWYHKTDQRMCETINTIWLFWAAITWYHFWVCLIKGVKKTWWSLRNNFPNENLDTLWWPNQAFSDRPISNIHGYVSHEISKYSKIWLNYSNSPRSKWCLLGILTPTNH